MIRMVLARLALFAVAPAGAFSGEDAELRAAAVARLREAEASLNDIRIEAETRAEAWNAEKEEWEYAGESAFTVTYPGTPRSRARVDFHRMVTRWVDGVSAFAVVRRSAGYNGRDGKTLTTQQGSSESPAETLDGTIEGRRPPIIDHVDGLSAWHESSLGFSTPGGERFSDFVEKSAGRTTLAWVAAEENANELRLTLKNGPREEHWVLDPRHGYSIAAHVSHGSEGTVRERFVAERFLEAAPNLFYPAEALMERFGRDGRPEYRTRLLCRAVVANDPAFSEDVFDLQFPPGTFVRDLASDEAFTVGKDPPELEKAIGGEVAAAKSAPIRPADEDVLARAAVRVARFDENEPSSRVWIWIAAAAIALALAAIAFARRRRTWRGVAAGSAILVLAAAPARGEGAALAIEALGSQRVSNCGLNTALFVLRYFGAADAGVEDLATELGAGRHYEEPVDLLSLKRAFERRGLGVKSVENASPDETVRAAGAERLAVVHVRGCDAGAGHYYVVVGRSEKGDVYVVDTGQGGRFMERSEFDESIGKRATGYALFVGTAPARGAEDLAASGGVIEFDAGRVDEGRGPFDVRVPVRNGGRTPLRLIESRGSCDCFRSASFPGGTEWLPPGAESTLVLRFEREELPVGRGTQDVLLRLGGEAAPRESLVRVRVEVVRVRPADRVNWYPNRLDFGVWREGEAPEKPFSVSLRIPAGVRLRGASASSESLSLDLVESRSGGSSRAGDARLYSHEVRLADPPVGRLRESVRFELEGGTLHSIEIPVIGECRPARR